MNGAGDENSRVIGPAKQHDQEKAYLPKGKNYLLSIGIDTYPNFPRLYNAVKDAQDVAELLTSKYQFSPKHQTLLINEKASQGAIYKQLERLSDEISDQDCLLIYFSGHGEYSEKLDNGFWIPYDGENGNVGSFLQFTLLQSYIRAINSHHTVVIADSCYAGSMFTTRSTDSYKDRLESAPSRWLITAGRNEVVADGKPGDNSPFAEALLDILRRNEEERLKVADLADQIAGIVSANARQTPHAAEMYGVKSKRGQFMFRLKDVAHKVFEKETMGQKVKQPETFRTVEAEVVEEEHKLSDFKNFSDFKRGLKKIVAAAQLKEAFDLLEEAIDPDTKMYDNVCVLLKSRFNRIERERDIKTEVQTKRSFAQVEHTLLQYLQELEEEDLNTGIFSNANTGGSSSRSNLSELEKSQLKAEAEGLIRQIAFFKEELNTSYNSAQKFSLTIDIEKKEARLKEIKGQLGEL